MRVHHFCIAEGVDIGQNIPRSETVAKVVHAMKPQTDRNPYRTCAIPAAREQSSKAPQYEERCRVHSMVYETPGLEIGPVKSDARTLRMSNIYCVSVTWDEDLGIEGNPMNRVIEGQK